MGFAPGLPGLFRGIQPLGGSGGSDASLDLSADYAPHLSLRQYSVGSVASYTYDSSGGVNHIAGAGLPSDTDTDSFGWPPCTASFDQDTLPGSLLVCIGVLNAEASWGFDDPNEGSILMDAGADSWDPDMTFSIFDHFLPGLPSEGGGDPQVTQATGVLGFRMNAPVVPAGQLFYGGLGESDYCNNFTYQLILAEFACVGATQSEFSYNNLLRDDLFPDSPPVIGPGDPLSVTGRLPRDNPSFVISVVWSNPGTGAAAGSGFALGPAPTLGSQWQFAEFAPQDDGYASPQWPTFSDHPGLTGSFELGFNGVGVSVITPVNTFIWNVLPTTGGGGGGGGSDLNTDLPNVCIIC